MNDDILTIDEAATVLKVTPDVISDLLECGEVPGRQIGGQWRTTKRALIGYVDGMPYGDSCCCCEPPETSSESSSDDCCQTTESCCC